MLPVLTKQKLYELYITKKLSTYKIAAIYNCYPAQMRKLLQKHNIKIRSRKEAMILDRGIKISKSYLRKLYLQNNLSIYQIAPLLNCYPSTVAKKLHEFNINIKPHSEKIKISKKELENLYIKKKLSTYKIAKILNCTVMTIRKRMQKYRIVVRPLKKVFIEKNTLENYYLKNKLSLSKIGKIYNINAVAVLKKIRKYRIPLRKSWETNTIHIKKPFSGSIEEKAYLIGFRLGDLGVRQKSTKTYSVLVGCNSTKIEQINLIKSLFEKYSHIWISTNSKGVTSVTTLLHPSFSFLIPKQDNIESWIINHTKYIMAFIAGYTDAEGSIGVYAGRAKFRLGSYDFQILKQITEELKKRNIRAILKLEVPKGFINKQGVINNGDFWRITVNEKQSLFKLFNLLLPYMKHEKRINNLVEAKNNIIQRNNAIIHA